MGRFNYIQNGFIKGEVSPKVYGRTDQRDYIQGASQLTNVIPYLQGGAGSRPGAQYVQDMTAFFNIENKRLIPFIFNKSEKYLLALGTDPSKLYIKNVNSGAVNSPIVYLPDTYSATNFLAAELPEVQFAQSADRLIIVHPNHEPILISRLATDTFMVQSWNLSVPTYSTPVGGLLYGASSNSRDLCPYRSVNADSTFTMQIGAVSGATTLTCSKAFFNTAHVGAFFRVTDIAGAGSCYGQVTGYTSTTVVSFFISGPNAPNTTATVDWEESSWSNFRGWPRTVCFYQQRIYFGGNATQPDTIWGSTTGNIFNFTTPRTSSTNASGFQFTLAATEVNFIQWMNPGTKLLIGTQGQEYISEGTDPNLALGLTNIGFNAETAYGSSYIGAIKAGTGLLFVQRNGHKVREFTFFYQEQGYKGEDITIQADHMLNKSLSLFPNSTSSNIKEMVYQSDIGALWFVDSNGGLFGCTHDRELGVTAWHSHVLAGSFGSTPPVILSSCVLPSADGTFDELYLYVQRDQFGGSGYSIIKIGSEFQLNSLLNSSTNIKDKPVYMDFIQMYQSGSAITTVAGFLNVPAGSTVAVIADGQYLGTQVVASGGTITVASAAKEFLVGLPYTSTIALLPILAGSIIGSPQGEIQRFDKIAIRFNRTVGANFGDGVTMTPITFPLDPANAGNPIPLFTGEMWLDFPGDYGRDPLVKITQTSPLPFSVTSLTLRGITYE